MFDHLPGQDTVLVKEQFNLVNNVPDPLVPSSEFTFNTMDPPHVVPSQDNLI
jgi:hypothetical protein